MEQIPQKSKVFHVKHSLICWSVLIFSEIVMQYTGCFVFTGTPLKVLSTKKLIWARLGVSRPIYVNVDSSNLGFPYFDF